MIRTQSQILLAWYLYSTGDMIWVFCCQSSMPGHSKLSCWCSSHQQQWRKPTDTKEERKNWILKKEKGVERGRRCWCFRSCLCLSFLKFIRIQVTLCRQKYHSLHSIFKFSRGKSCCKQTVLGISSIVHGECMCTPTLVQKNWTVKAESSYTFQIYLAHSSIYSLPGIVPPLLSSMRSNSAIYNKSKTAFRWLCKFHNSPSKLSVEVMWKGGISVFLSRWGQSVLKTGHILWRNYESALAVALTHGFVFKKCG